MQQIQRLFKKIYETAYSIRVLSRRLVVVHLATILKIREGCYVLCISQFQLRPSPPPPLG